MPPRSANTTFVQSGPFKEFLCLQNIPYLKTLNFRLVSFKKSQGHQTFVTSFGMAREKCDIALSLTSASDGFLKFKGFDLFSSSKAL